jgi:hypothetical protein
MDRMDQPNVGDRDPEPTPHPGRDLPPPSVDEPPEGPGSDHPPVRDPPLQPEGNRPQIACLLAHDLFRKPVPNFRDHALTNRERSDGISR